MKKTIAKLSLVVASALALVAATPPLSGIFIEAESMDSLGGWVLDQQSMVQMGSPYIMAHGMGVPVEDASTTFVVEDGGTYYLWVRTKDWTRVWGRTESPGRFEVYVNGNPVKAIMGTEKADWYWQSGGKVKLKKGENVISLHDLTGFNGRCDAIYLTRDKKLKASDIDAMRPKSVLKEYPEEFDLVVVGGGTAGCCAAISAARLGCKVAFIQNRPVLGGNNSSEVRVGLSGLIMQKPYPNLGNLMDEIGGVGYHTRKEAQQDPESERSKQIMAILKKHPEKKIHNAGPASNYEDDKKLNAVLAEPNITLFLNTHVLDAETKNNRIVSVTGQNIKTGERIIFRGKFFADCTGDGDVGFLAGADYRVGRESKAETGEKQAPKKADSMVMGTSVQWYADDMGVASSFPSCPWALKFNEATYRPIKRGDWDWEVGLTRDQVNEIEYIRDYALLSVFGNWDYLKNKSLRKYEFYTYKLQWVAYIGGKRESRRLLGDVILTEHDILEGKKFDDASFTTTWGMDLHYPKKLKGFEGEPFLSYCEVQKHEPYACPYRCLYSRNIDNLFMAGRNISVTHAALGTVRVMRTTGMMGEIVGMATSICKNNNALPRDVYTTYLNDLKSLMEKGVGTRGFKVE